MKGSDDVVRQAESFHVGVYFGADYLRTVNPYETLTLFDPLNTYHPNVAFGAPFICVGRIAPGMPLVDLLYQVYEILTYQKLTPREDDALNKEACRWARANQGLFPHRPSAAQAASTGAGGGAHMTMLDKHLARFAQECQRLDADRWRLALTNGHSLTVSARRDEDFLLLDADTGVRPAAELLVPLAERSHELPAAVKFALRGSTALRLRAEFPLPEESSVAADRIRGHLEGMRSALHRLHDWVSREAAGEGMACPEPQGDGQAIPGSLAELLKEAGWEFHERPGGELLADLETGSQFLQAEIEPCGAGARFRRDAVSRRRGRRRRATGAVPVPARGQRRAAVLPEPSFRGRARASRPVSRCGWKARLRRRRRATRWRRFRWRAGNAAGKWKS